MNADRVRRIRKCADLLELPAPEVVRELCDELLKYKCGACDHSAQSWSKDAQGRMFCDDCKSEIEFDPETGFYYRVNPGQPLESAKAEHETCRREFERDNREGR